MHTPTRPASSKRCISSLVGVFCHACERRIDPSTRVLFSKQTARYRTQSVVALARMPSRPETTTAEYHPTTSTNYVQLPAPPLSYHRHDDDTRTYCTIVLSYCTTNSYDTADRRRDHTRFLCDNPDTLRVRVATNNTSTTKYWSTTTVVVVCLLQI